MFKLKDLAEGKTNLKNALLMKNNLEQLPKKNRSSKSFRGRYKYYKF